MFEKVRKSLSSKPDVERARAAWETAKADLQTALADPQLRGRVDMHRMSVHEQIAAAEATLRAEQAQHNAIAAERAYANALDRDERSGVDFFALAAEIREDLEEIDREVVVIRSIQQRYGERLAAAEAQHLADTQRRIAAGLPAPRAFPEMSHPTMQLHEILAAHAAKTQETPPTNPRIERCKAELQELYARAEMQAREEEEERKREAEQAARARELRAAAELETQNAPSWEEVGLGKQIADRAREEAKAAAAWLARQVKSAT